MFFLCYKHLTTIMKLLQKDFSSPFLDCITFLCTCVFFKYIFLIKMCVFFKDVRMWSICCVCEHTARVETRVYKGCCRDKYC